MNTERIKEIQQETAYPESRSVQQALLKVWNECEQSKEKGRVNAIVMWQPIEKARFDSVWYLVKEKDDDMHIAIWDDEEGIWTNGYFEVKPVKFIELGVLAKLPDAT